MRKIIGLIFLSGILYSGVAFGQASTCTQTLRLVQSTYEQGRLHELEALMQGCLDDKKNGFDDQQKVTAYKYLTLAYIYLEEPEKADATMLKLLNTGPAGHFFTPNDAVDPAEFIALWRKFRRDPLFRYGFKLGLTSTMPSITETFYVASGAQGNGKYTPGLSFYGALVFEKDFPLLLKNFSIAPEISFMGRSYTYKNDSFNKSDINPDSAITIHRPNKFKQTWIDLNLLVQYKIKNGSLNPYIGFGPGINYLLDSKNEMISKVSGQGAVTGPKIDMKSSYKSIAYSAIVVVGAKYRFGAFYLTGDIRYQYGFNNVVNTSKRSNAEALRDYGYVLPNYRHNNLTINIGIVIPYFNPKKLIK